MAIAVEVEMLDGLIELFTEIEYNGAFTLLIGLFNLSAKVINFGIEFGHVLFEFFEGRVVDVIEESDAISP